MFFKRLRNRRKELKNDILELQENKKEIIKERTKLAKELKKDKQKQITINPSIHFCPYIQQALQMEMEFQQPNEPFGWNKGTVRGIITLWVSITACIGFIFGKIPEILFGSIIMMVVSSYFVSRVAFNSRPPYMY